MSVLEFRKYGNGSQVYEVLLAVSYNPITKRTNYETIGFIQKIDGCWEAMDGKPFTGKTRKEVAEKLLMDYTLNKGEEK